MRVFKKMNISGKDVCPICGTKENKEAVLIAKEGTQEGFNAEAIQVHLDCLDLWINEEIGIIYQRIGGGKLVK
jgi:hypothetical protein